MRVLFLDDNDNRIDLAKANFSGDNLYIAKTAQEAITLFMLADVSEPSGFDLAMLDHDLGGKQAGYGIGNEPTGMTVVQWIVEHRPIVKRFVVHSWNQPAAIEMVARLCNVGYSAEWKPFVIIQ